MLRLTLTFLLLNLLSSSYAIDSLRLNRQLQELEVAQDTQRLRILKELSWELRQEDNSRAKAFMNEGLELALELGDSLNYYSLTSNSGMIYAANNEFEKGLSCLSQGFQYYKRNGIEDKMNNCLVNLGNVFSFSGEYHKADSVLQKAEIYYVQLKDEKKLMNLLQMRGVNFHHQKKYEEAKQYYEESLIYSRKFRDEKVSSKLLSNLGGIESNQDNYVKALDYYLEASKFDKDNVFFHSNIISNIGSTYNNIGDWDKAIIKHKEALTIRQKAGWKKWEAYSLNNLGLVYKNKRNYGEAIKCYEEALEIISKLESADNGLSGMVHNLGLVYLNMKEYKEAEVHFKRALKLKKELKDERGISMVLSNLGETYRKSRDFHKGIKYGKQSLEIANRIGFTRFMELSTKSISDSYVGLGDYKKAYAYRTQYWEVRDSMSDKKSTSKIAELEMKFEATKKEAELKHNAQQIKDLKNEKKIDQLKIGVLTLSCLALILLGIILTYLYQQGKKKLIKNKILSELKIDKVEKEKGLLVQKISKQEAQLENYLKELIIKSDHLLNLKNEAIEYSKQEIENDSVNNINVFLNKNQQSEKDWEKFEYYFTMVHKDFFKKLNTAFANLSTNDLNICALIKLNRNNKEIAQMLGISPASIKKARQRLYLKMNLENNDALRNYIIQL